MLVPLSSLKIGMKGKIQSIDFEEQVKERFLAMGFVPGKDIELVHVSPFGDPMVFLIDDNKIMIRREQAGKILIDVGFLIETLFSIPDGMCEVFTIDSGMMLYERLKSLGIYPGITGEKHLYKGKIFFRTNQKDILLGKRISRKILCKKYL